MTNIGRSFRKKKSLSFTLDYCATIGGVLDNSQVLHCDIKPDNILVQTVENAQESIEFSFRNKSFHFVYDQTKCIIADWDDYKENINSNNKDKTMSSRHGTNWYNSNQKTTTSKWLSAQIGITFLEMNVKSTNTKQAVECRTILQTKRGKKERESAVKKISKDQTVIDFVIKLIVPDDDDRLEIKEIIAHPIFYKKLNDGSIVAEEVLKYKYNINLHDKNSYR
eukprot:313334_1